MNSLNFSKGDFKMSIPNDLASLALGGIIDLIKNCAETALLAKIEQSVYKIIRKLLR